VSTWRRQAVADLPQLKAEIESARVSSVMSLWIELFGHLQRAYEAPLLDEDLVAGI